MRPSLCFEQLLTAALLAASPAAAHLAAYTDGMYCPDNTYQGPLKNTTDPSLVVFDPLYNLTFDSWFLSKGRNCLLAEPTGVWEIAANSEISVPWANWQNSTGYYADGKEQDQRPIPYSVTNPQVVADGLVSSSGGISSPNMHCGNKSTAAGTAIAVAYVDDVYAVTMENLVVVSTAPETPFERLANYTIPDLAACESCICVTGWVPDGYGLQNMYMAAHKCKITNPKGGKVPKTPSLVPGPGVKGPKQMIAAFQQDGNNIEYTPGDKVPTYSTGMGYMDGEQTDIFDESGSSEQVSSHAVSPTTSTAPKSSVTSKSSAAKSISPPKSTSTGIVSTLATVTRTSVSPPATATATAAAATSSASRRPWCRARRSHHRKE